MIAFEIRVSHVSYRSIGHVLKVVRRFQVPTWSLEAKDGPQRHQALVSVFAK